MKYEIKNKYFIFFLNFYNFSAPLKRYLYLEYLLDKLIEI